MKLYSGKKRHGFWGLVLSLVLFAAILAAFAAGVADLSENAEEEGRRASEDALKRAAAACYATEGFYPESETYLEEHYGVCVDRGRYVVSYQTLGSNIAPAITVIPLGN